MAIPGFSAEMSLCKSRQTYLVTGISSGQHSQVIPQVRIRCWVGALALYQECLGTVLGIGRCAMELEYMFETCERLA